MTEDDDTKQPEDTTEVVVEQADDAAPQQEAKADDTEAALADLRGQLEAEKARRISAESKVSELANSEHAARIEATDSNYNLVVNAIDTLRVNQNSLKSQYAAAMEAGDFAAAAEVQVAMSDTASKLLQLEQGKTAMEQQPKPERQPVQTDPVEALASQLTPRSGDWVRQHPQYATDQRLYTKMIAAHNIAVADGLVPDTDAYFNSVEAILGHGQSATVAVAETPTEDPMSAAARPSAPKSPPAAPVSRGGGSSRLKTLTPEQAEVAKLNDMTLEEYARKLEEAQKRGEITTH